MLAKNELTHLDVASDWLLPKSYKIKANMLFLVHILAIRAVNILPTSMPPETYSENFATPFHLVRRHTPAQTVCQKPSLLTRPVARISTGL